MLIPVVPSFVPYTDLASEIVCSVIAIAILPSAIPLKISFSFGIKVPLVSYTVTAVPAETACLKNPVAPLLSPLTNVGIDKVCA